MFFATKPEFLAPELIVRSIFLMLICFVLLMVAAMSETLDSPAGVKASILLPHLNASAHAALFYVLLTMV